MLARIAAVIGKEFIEIWRDRRTLAIILSLPMIQLLLLGYAVNTAVDHLPLIVFDESRDPRSRDLVDALRNSGYFDLRATARSQAEALAAIDAGQARAALLIPPDFGALLLHGEAAPAQLVIDGSDPSIAQTALFTSGSIALARSVDLVTLAAERRGASLPVGGIDLRPVLLYNPRMLTVVFMVPALLGMILQYQTIILTSAAIVRERELGSLEQLMVTPVRSWELMVGKLVPYAVIAEGSAAMALLVGRFWFGVEIAGSLGLLFVVSLVFVLGSLGVGLLISTLSRTQRQAQQLAQFLLLPALLLSGFLTTREAMPAALQYLSLFVPATYFLQVLRGVMLKGVGLEVLWPQVWPLAVFGAVVFGVAAALFQKRLG